MLLASIMSSLIVKNPKQQIMIGTAHSHRVILMAQTNHPLSVKFFSAFRTLLMSVSLWQFLAWTDSTKLLPEPTLNFCSQLSDHFPGHHPSHLAVETDFN